ncbi:MAG: NAD(P)/FAD-dependent oxidoreductase [Proteobacteria bacterium]|nr:NAD(P)/FAD-dependent oxidoreductase [Pseudomonadota bacterium]
MKTRVTRRDFLNGVAIGTGGMLLQGYGSDTAASTKVSPGAPATFTPADSSGYYPPTLTGMRGSHDGSFEVAHDLAWQGKKPSNYEALNEHYDLVVVGAGMSGLAAARFYQKKMGPDAKILIMDNHDDFGGHAKRNEFHQNGRMMLSLGGAQNLEAPDGYSKMASSLMHDIGITEEFVASMTADTPADQFLAGNMDAPNGVSLPGPSGHTSLSGNWVAVMYGGQGYEDYIRSLPISGSEQEKFIDFFGGKRDFTDDLSLKETWEYINSVSYNRFLLDRVGLEETSLPVMNAMLVHLTGMSGWNLSVLEGISQGGPGIKSLGWLSRTTASIAGKFIGSLLNVEMFPDGNASVARLLVQKLIPAVSPDMQGPEDVAIARFNYDALDRGNQPVRLRLNSTVVGAREIDGERVEVDYVQKGQALRVTADHCVMACYNALIPHLCPEMPQAQKEGLSYGVKTPFVYANVQLDNGRAYEKLGAQMFQCPHDPFQWVSSAPGMSVGGYEPPRGPDDPMVVFMMNSPMTEGQEQGSGRDQLRMGRHRVYSTPFATYEQQIREQLQSMLGQHGPRARYSRDYGEPYSPWLLLRLPHPG